MEVMTLNVQIHCPRSHRTAQATGSHLLLIGLRIPAQVLGSSDFRNLLF